MTERTFDEPIECSECGHRHFYPTPLLYWPCPVDGCTCEHDDSELLDLMGEAGR